MANTAVGIRHTVLPWVRRHRPAVDAGLFLLISVVAAWVGIVGFWSVFAVLPTPASPWWSLVTAVPACAMVLVRDRFPLATLVATSTIAVVDLASFGGIGPLFVVIDALFVATRAASPRRRRSILIALVAVVAVIVAAILVVRRDVGLAAVIGIQLGAVLGTAYWYATAVAQSRELVALHRRRAEDAEALAARDRVVAVEREREAMARELHDLVAGHVSAMAIRAEASLAAPPDGQRDRAALRAVRDSGLEAHEALRSMIAVLRAGDRSDDLVAPPRRSGLPALVDDARRSGLRVSVRDDIAGELPGPVDQTAARIVQEALANCLRHAAGALVEVQLADDGDDVVVRVHSRDGVALQHPPLEGSGWGLELIRERARALGGELTAGPQDDGWTVRARLPRGVPV